MVAALGNAGVQKEDLNEKDTKVVFSKLVLGWPALRMRVRAQVIEA